jgi:hypothetical protein
MQVAKIQLAILAARKFINVAEDVLQQSGSTTSFLLCNGKHAKTLKQLSNKVIQSMQDMRRP